MSKPREFCVKCHKEMIESDYDARLAESKNWNDGYSKGIKQGEKQTKEAADKLAEALDSFNQLLENEFGHKVCGPKDRCGDHGLTDSAKVMHQCYEASKQALKEYRGNND